MSVEFIDNLKEILYDMTEGIGPKNMILDEAFDSENGLKWATRTFFSTLNRFEDIVKKQKIANKEFLNSASVSALYYVIISQLCRAIVDRNKAITDRLHKYLSDDDVLLVEQEIDRILSNSYDEHKVVLITNLIKLEDASEVSIGNVSIKKIGTDYFNRWPNEVEKGVGLSALLLGRNLSKVEMAERHKGKVALEVLIPGYHMSTEQSYVIERAVYNFKQVFAFLNICKEYLSSRAKSYIMKTEVVKTIDLGFLGMSSTEGYQDYYVEKKKPTDQVLTVQLLEKLTEQVFILSNETIELLCSRCFLKKYNDLTKGGIKDKLSISLDWYLKSTFEKDLTDRAISMFISLESLMSFYSEPLTGHTDELAENIAYMISPDSDKRYKYKQDFKKDIYKLRNKIMHGGQKCTEDDYASILQLRLCIVSSCIGILNRLEKILQYGNDVKALKEYFERLKLNAT